MITTLVYDYDNSLASIGGEIRQLECFGLPPIRIHKGLEQTKSIIRNLIKPVKKTITHPLFDNVPIEEDGFEFTKKAKEMDVNCLVFDTISALGLQERMQIKQKRRLDTLDQRSWGIYGDSMNSFIYNITSLPVKTIFNVHIDRERDADDKILELPALKGASKVEASKWFDVILYNKVSRDPKTKQVQFSWLTKPVNGKLAKDRLGLLDEIMPQDFNLIYSKYEEAGIPYPNILVLGDSGTGKTKALESINYNSSEIRKAS